MTYHPFTDSTDERGYPHSRKTSLLHLYFELVRMDHSKNYEEIDIQAKGYEDFRDIKDFVQRWWTSPPGSLEESALWRRLKRISLQGLHRDGEQLLFDWV